MKPKEKKKSKHQDLADKIMAENPVSNYLSLTDAKFDWQERINNFISELSVDEDNPNVADPIGVLNEISYHIRSIAESLIRDKKVIAQMVRPDGPEEEIYIKKGKVSKKFSRGTPVGAMVAFITDGELLIGWSKYCQATKEIAILNGDPNSNFTVTAVKKVPREKNPFSKKVAVKTAVLRALTDQIHVNISAKFGSFTASSNHIPQVVSSQLPSFVKRASLYFKMTPSNYIPINV